uniref:Uncharacterized protein n=1 Tax=Mycena chlorophos TaxID=658473 RepID=A0ABQ0KXS1_MYCCL|nr:predicted protein [Mycena chlorophos]
MAAEGRKSRRWKCAVVQGRARDPLIRRADNEQHARKPKRPAADPTNGQRVDASDTMQKSARDAGRECVNGLVSAETCTSRAARMG